MASCHERIAFGSVNWIAVVTPRELCLSAETGRHTLRSCGLVVGALLLCGLCTLGLVPRCFLAFRSFEFVNLSSIAFA